MLFEYALEPSLLSSWPIFQQLIGHFGVEHGRLISRYPGKWKKMVYEGLADCTPLDKHRITESLTRIDDRLLPRECVWQNRLDWLQNVESEHEARPFHAIIAESNPRDFSCVVLHEALDPTAPPSLWKVARSQPVERNAASMAATLRPLLHLGKIIVLVDPHFGPENHRHRIVLESITKAIAGGLRGRSWPAIRYVTGDKAESAFFRNECSGKLPPLIAKGCKIEFVTAPQSSLHNRYVLTDRGGVQLGDGLDEGDAGTGRTDLFTLLDAATALELFAHYLDNTKLRVSQIVTVEGRSPF